MTNPTGPSGLLLTGGRSTRMGRDKATLVVAGRPLAQRTATLLGAVTARCLEVGPGVSGLEAVREDPPGAGPLAALVTGANALRERGQAEAALVVACDLPLLSLSVLSTLATWPGERSVVPVVDGRTQPLCARWCAADLDLARTLHRCGARSMRALVERAEPLFIEPSMWPASVKLRELADVDTPEDLVALGLEALGPEALGPGRDERR